MMIQAELLIESIVGMLFEVTIKNVECHLQLKKPVLIFHAFLAVILPLYWSACTSTDSEEKQWIELQSSSELNNEELLSERFWKFSQRYPTSKHAASAMLSSARLLDANGKSVQAIQRYTLVEKTFPQSSEAAQSAFLIGYAYSNNLLDTAMAKKAFFHFLESYPNSDLRDAANFELVTMGKSPEFIFQTDSVAVK